MQVVVAEATSLPWQWSMVDGQEKRVPQKRTRFLADIGTQWSVPDVGLRCPGRFQQIDHVELPAGALERSDRREVGILPQIRMAVSLH